MPPRKTVHAVSFLLFMLALATAAVLCGELGLDGAVRSVRGGLAIADLAARRDRSAGQVVQIVR